MCEMACAQAAEALLYAPPSMQADRSVVLAAVRRRGWALEFAADALRADKAVVSEAVGVAI